MIKTTLLRAIFIISLAVFFVSCSNTKEDNKNDSQKKEQKISNSQSLIKEIIKRGDYANSANCPSLISADELNQNLDSNILIIDVRNGKEYADGHIKGAVKLKLKELVDYFQVSGTPDYNKVVIVCYTGQMASYATSILRMKGYNNVYALDLGMCSWNEKFSKRRIKNSTNRLGDKLETKNNPKLAKSKLPEIKSKRKPGVEILNSRVKKIMKEGFKDAATTIDDIISDPGAYFIINYNLKEAYDAGHLQGAIHYAPGSLKYNSNLLTLPKDKTIVIYDNDGQNSACVVAYLKLLGYDAKTLKYGANGFMNDIMNNNEKAGRGFNDKLIHNFKFETSKYIEEEGGVEEGGC